MSHKVKIVLIGAGSLQFGLGTVGSILSSSILNGATICLHDINPDSLAMVKDACQAAISSKKLNFTLESTTDRKKALQHADYIINSIEVAPRFDFWEQDFTIPKKLGSKQIFGENGGPGGMFHALRIIPPILEICRDIQTICPNAWLINFSNPMSRICLAIYRQYPSLKVVGLCHEIKFIEDHMPIILNTPLTNLDFHAGGLNHFSVVLDIHYRDSGKDAYPDLRTKGAAYLRSLRPLHDNHLTSYIFDTYHYFPITSDSHYGEYIHWAWEKADLVGVENFRIGYREMTLSEGKRIKRFIQKGKGEKLVVADNERAVPIIEAMLTDAHIHENAVNIPNQGIISNLPTDLVVECPALIDKQGIHGTPLGEYPRGLAALLRTEASVQDLVVDAALKRSKEIALQALLASSLVDSTQQAVQILDEMLKLQKTWLHLE